MSLRIAVNSEFRLLTNFFFPKNGRRKSVIFGDDFRPKKIAFLDFAAKRTVM